MNLLFFHLEVQFGTDIKLVANNEVDLEQYLIKEKQFLQVEFYDLKSDYGTCILKDHFGNKEIAKCYYVTKI